MSREPLAIRAAIVAAVSGAINVLVLFGVDLSVEQVTGLNTLVGLVGTMVVVVWSRGAVTPVADPKDANGQPLVAADDY